MSQKWGIAVPMLIVAACFATVHGEEPDPGQYEKRSPDFPSFSELLGSSSQTLTIENTDCSMSRSDSGKNGCKTKFKKSSGSCPFESVLAQLFPAVDLAALTKKFMTAEKFALKDFTFDQCNGKNHETVMFSTKSQESLEIQPQYLTLGARAKMRISWTYTEEPTLKNININLQGHTSVGSNTAVNIQLRKKVNLEDFSITMKIGSLSVSDLLGKFGIETSQLINDELQSERNMLLGRDSVHLQSPEIKGIFSPGEGFELTATGGISAPELPSDADKFYVIVQDFKKSEEAEGQTERGFKKPIGAVFALYKKRDADVTDNVMSLTGLRAPELKVFRGVKELAITAATDDIVFVNYPKLHDLISKFVPAKGLNVMEKGLNLLHFTSNSNSAIKDEEGQTKESIILRCQVTEETLSWITPEIISTTVQQVATMAFPDKSLSNIVLEPTTTVRFVSINLTRDTRDLIVSFNLTQIVPVLENNLVALLNATMSLVSSPDGRSRDYQDWRLAGKGREVILDELVDINVEQTSSRTIVNANANIFSMTTLRNRSKASFLDDAHAKAFPYSLDFPLQEMRYEAVFEFDTVLKMKGKLGIAKSPAVEILYFLDRGGPQMKVAILYKNEYLHNVVNTLYGEEKMRTTWMRFEKIGIVLRKKKGEVEFDRQFFKNVDSFHYSACPGKVCNGVGIIAERFALTDCPPEAKMCNFLDMHIRKNPMIQRTIYTGKLGVTKMKMSATIFPAMWLSEHFVFGGPIKFIMSTNEKGDRNVLESEVYFSSYDEKYKAKIYDDGTNVLILKIGEGAESQRSMLLDLDFAYMQPVHALYAIPDKRTLQGIDLKSRLHLGTVEGSTIAFSGSTGRQYIHFSNDQRKFVGERPKLMVKTIEVAFGISGTHDRIKHAAFQHQVVVGYNSIDEVWSIPDFNVKVKKGLHFFGKLRLNDDEEYQATVTIADTLNQLEAEMEIPALRYGKSLTDSEGRRNFRSVNLFLFKEPGRQETGPTLYVTNAGQRIKGHCQTIGMQGAFESTYTRRPGGRPRMRLQIELNGRMYDEVEDVRALLTTSGEGTPSEYSFQYQIDVTNQARANLKKTFRDALGEIKEQMRKGKESATGVHSDVLEQYSNHVERKQQHEAEMERVQAEIFEANQNVDQDILDISTNCIDKCKTVSMPGIDWKDDCLSEPGSGKRTMRCMTWNENKEKVVNVICLLKCEAIKFRASGSGNTQLDNIRLLLNRYKQTKTMAENEERMIAVLEEAKTAAEETRRLIETSTNFDEDINTLLEKPESDNMATITRVSVDEDVNDLLPPCLPFRLIFTINAPGQSSQDGKYDVCFNGEFYQNLGVRMLRVSYPQIDLMYKALEEAELRYAQIKGIKKSLERVMEDIEKNVKVPDEAPTPRSELEQPEMSPLERRLERISKRAIPKFTSKNDKTQMGFRHYSPWAVARRSDLFHGMNTPPDAARVYNLSTFEGHTDCNKARKAIEHYQDVASGLRTVSDHYEGGKKVFGSTKESLMKDLKDSYDFIMEANQENMMYWFRYTEAGLKDYFDTYTRQLDEHNKRGLEVWRSDISSFFDQGRLFDELHQIGHQAYSRSNIPNKEAHVRSFNSVGQTMQQVLSQPGLTLEQALSMVTSIDPQINNLHKSTFSCN